MFGSPAAATRVGNQSSPDTISLRRNLAGPADDRRHAEPALKRRTLATCERGLAAIWPSEVLRAVVSGEGNDGAVVYPHLLHLLHDRTDDVVKLRHTGFLDRPAIFGRAHLLVLVGEVGDDVHAGGIEPEEERLAVVLRLLN